MNSCLLSILIPMYNAEKYIKNAILSVQNQIDSDYEILVIDDGSTDDSYNIVSLMSQANDKIKLCHQENEHNIYSIRKKLISAATGAYCLFLDADDSWENNLWSVLEPKIIKEENDIVFFNFKVVSEKNTCEVKNNFESDIGVVENDCVINLLHQLFFSDIYNSLWSKCFKRSLFCENDFFVNEKISMGEDLILSLIMLRNAKKIDFVQDCLYLYRKTENSLTSNYKLSYFDDYSIVYKYMQKMSLFFDQNKLFEIAIAKRYIVFISKTVLAVNIDNVSNKEKLKKCIAEKADDIEFQNSFKLAKKTLPFVYKNIGNSILRKRLRWLVFLNKNFHKIKHSKSME